MDDLHSDFHRALDAGIYPPLLLCAAYMSDFTVIHPFRDGNGRMSRLITLWLLYIVGHNQGAIKPLGTGRSACWRRLSRD